MAHQPRCLDILASILMLSNPRMGNLVSGPGVMKGCKGWLFWDPIATDVLFNTVNPYMAPNGYGPPNQYYPQESGFRPDLPAHMQPIPSQTVGARMMYPGMDPMGMGRLPQGGSQPQGMFTRNLIGSLAASAFRLSDTGDKIGIWFILQDLSVRTEGTFR